MDPTCRPIVKRTYSRLPLRKDDLITTSESEKENSSFNQSQEVDVTRSIKKTKITDFFKKKSDGDSSFLELSPLAKLKLESSPLQAQSSKRRQTQTYLDLGQSGLVSTQCPDCLMHYNKSFPEDKALHKRFHAQYLKGFRYDPEDTIAQELAPPPEKLSSWRRYRFFAGGESFIKKLDPFLRFVSVQLGAAPLELHEMKALHSLIIAIDASSTEIVACALFEPIKRAYLSKIGCSEASIELDECEFSVQWGVSRIWTGMNHRQRGLASLVLELKTRNRDSLAFSQPTPTGFIFAKAFQSKCFNHAQCLIYLNNR